jgi:hypothetical protein
VLLDNIEVARIIVRQILFELFDDRSGASESRVNIHPEPESQEGGTLDRAWRFLEPNLELLENIPDANFNRVERFSGGLDFEAARQFLYGS